MASIRPAARVNSCSEATRATRRYATTVPSPNITNVNCNITNLIQFITFCNINHKYKLDLFLRNHITNYMDIIANNMMSN